MTLINRYFLNKELITLIKKNIEASKNVNILYLDMNNLYGSARRQYLPINNFKCIKNIDKIEQNLMKIKNNSSTGCVLKVNIEKRQDLHYIHNCY